MILAHYLLRVDGKRDPLYYPQVLATQRRQRDAVAHLVDVLDADCEILI
jgi:hypothetical protein